MSEPTGVLLGSDHRSAAQLARRAELLAAALAAGDHGPSGTVVLAAWNSFLPLEVSPAVAAAGLRAVLVNPKATASELAYVLADSGARLVIGHADVLRRLGEGIGPDVTVVAARTPEAVAAVRSDADATVSPPPGAVDYEEFLAHGATLPTPPPGEAALSSLFYTSGTTGRPKGVVRPAPTPAEVLRRREVTDTCYGVTAESRGLLTTPMHHMFGSNFALTLLRWERPLVIMPRWDAEEMLALVERHRITNLTMVPTMFARLLALPERVRSGYDTSSLRHVLHTAAPCPPHVKRALIDWWGPVVWEQYGTSETGVVALCDSAEWLAHPGTVGRPFHGSVLRVYDDEGRGCAPGETGTVYARMPGTPDFTYLGRPEARAAVERDGLVTGGDIGMLDADGYLHMRDRRADLVLVSGTNVYPAEVEAQIARFPGIADSVVFGVPDGDRGERVEAVVALLAQAPADVVERLREFLRSELSGYKVPHAIHVVAAVPRDESGKVRRREVREAYAAHDTASDRG